MKFIYHLIAIIPILVTFTQAAPLCKRESGLCNHIQTRDYAGDTVDELTARAQKPISRPPPKKAIPLPKVPPKSGAPPSKPASAAKAASAKAKPPAKAAAPKAKGPSPKARSAAAAPKKAVSSSQSKSAAAKGPKVPKSVAKAKAIKAANPLKPYQVSNKLTAIQKAQTKRKTLIDTKKKPLVKKAVKGLKQPKTNDPKKMTPADKKAQTAQNRAITSASKANKDAKTRKWDAKKLTPQKQADKKAAQTGRRAARKAGTAPPVPAQQAPKARPAKMNAAEKAQVKKSFSDANSKLRSTVGLPGRKDTYQVGSNKFSGKDVRQGIFNSHLHKDHPIGDNPANKNPKRFKNMPYASTHPDPALAGNKPIQASQYRGGKEYPIKSNSHNGWTGSGPVGAGRVITYENRGNNEFAVVGHDPSRGGESGDHYLAKHTKAKRELEFEDEE